MRHIAHSTEERLTALMRAIVARAENTDSSDAARFDAARGTVVDVADATNEIRLGERGTFAGTYIAHWEWPRFELLISRRLPGHRRVLCLLEPAEGVQWPFPLATKAHPQRYEVVVAGVPIEQGHFGHKGTLRYRIQVDRWLEIHEAD